MVWPARNASRSCAAAVAAQAHDIAATKATARIRRRAFTSTSLSQMESARPIALTGAGALTAEPVLVQRFDLDEGGLVVAAGPERHGRGRIIDEHAAHIGLGRQLILDALPGLGVEPHDAVGV